MSPALLPFGYLIGAEEFARFVTSSPGKRRRIYPPDVTLRAFLSQVVGRAGSCQEAVTEVCLANTLNSKRSPSLNTASYSRARGRLNVAAIKDLAPHLEDKMKFSQPLKEALDAMRQRITNKDGRPMY
ncbi:MAG: hypothetical protein FJ146_14530 [Deltaproteobacteria bacterium]|nr:hypothetical protein [Deltaproteobacteria bacterium]